MARWSLVLGVMAGLMGAVGPVGLGAVWAETPLSQSEDLAAFARLTRLSETFDVTRAEGLAQGAEMAGDMFGSDQGPEWAAALDRVYDPAAMQDTFLAAMSALLQNDPTLLAEVTPFFSSDLGQRIVELELEARRTALDPVAMAAATEVYAGLARENPERRDQIERLVVAADLLESNVTTALNGNLAFWKAMEAAMGAAGPKTPEEEMLSLIQADTAKVRADLAGLLYPLLTLAYSPLSRDDMLAYIEFYESPVGRRLNAALNAAFEPVMVDISRKLGAEAGRLMSGKTL